MCMKQRYRNTVSRYLRFLFVYRFLSISSCSLYVLAVCFSVCCYYCYCWILPATHFAWSHPIAVIRVLHTYVTFIKCGVCVSVLGHYLMYNHYQLIVQYIHITLLSRTSINQIQPVVRRTWRLVQLNNKNLFHMIPNWIWICRTEMWLRRIVSFLCCLRNFFFFYHKNQEVQLNLNLLSYTHFRRSIKSITNNWLFAMSLWRLANGMSVRKTK